MKIIWLSKTRTFSFSTRYGLFVVSSFLLVALFAGFLGGVIYHQYRAEYRQGGVAGETRQEKIESLTRILAELQAKLISLESMQQGMKTSQGQSSPQSKIPESTTNGITGRGGPFISPPSTESLTHSINHDLQKKNLDEILDAGRFALEHADSVDALLSQHQQESLRQEYNALYRPNLVPVNDGRLSSRFGLRRDPFNYAWAQHSGLDFAAPIGTPFYAAAAGRVEQVRFGGDYGLHLTIDHGGEYKTVYAHASRVFVGIGQLVHKGQFLGEVGSSGRSSGPHLHFEVRKNDIPLDPEELLNLKPFLAMSLE